MCINHTMYTTNWDNLQSRIYKGTNNGDYHFQDITAQKHQVGNDNDDDTSGSVRGKEKKEKKKKRKKKYKYKNQSSSQY